MTLNCRKSIIPAAVAALMALATLPGCFTGVERTAVIKDTSTSKEQRTLTPEQTLLDGVTFTLPAQWQKGKAFMVADGKPDLAYTPADEARKLQRGDTLRLESIKGISRLSGDSITEITLLTPSNTTLTHRVESPLSLFLSTNAPSLSLPFTVDLALVDTVRHILGGRRLWTLTTSRYTPEGKASSGTKFAPVTVTDVRPGSGNYPLEVLFTEQDGTKAMLLMVPESKTSTARTFNNLFSLSDPRKRYGSISDENWAKICKGEVSEGMTREECRLALGAPATVDREATYAGIVERWTYENGIYLFFTDGLLTRFRR